MVALTLTTPKSFISYSHDSLNTLTVCGTLGPPGARTGLNAFSTSTKSRRAGWPRWTDNQISRRRVRADGLH